MFLAEAGSHRQIGTGKLKTHYTPNDDNIRHSSFVAKPLIKR